MPYFCSFNIVDTKKAFVLLKPFTEALAFNFFLSNLFGGNFIVKTLLIINVFNYYDTNIVILLVIPNNIFRVLPNLLIIKTINFKINYYICSMNIIY